MRYHTETRSKLKEIPSVIEFNSLIESTTLSDMDKEILRLHYLKGKELSYIADALGYSEAWIKKKHVKALNKISKLI